MVLRRVLLTGASGMVGRHILAELVRRNIAVVASSRTPPAGLPEKSTYARWDLAEWWDPARFTAEFGSVDAIIHAGARVPLPSEQVPTCVSFDSNVRACLALGSWATANGIPLLFISGSTVYKDAFKIGIKETDELSPLGFGGFYGFTKLLGEQSLLHLTGHGLTCSILRASSIYGAGLDAKKVPSAFLATAARGEAIELTPSVDDRVDLIHAADVARAAVDALEQEAWGIFNIANGHPASMLEIAETCVEVVGRGSVRLLDGDGTRKPRTRFALDCAAAQSRFGFVPRVSLKDGLACLYQSMS